MSESEVEVVLPEWKAVNDREILVKETGEDESLKEWRDLADKGLRGYRWNDGLLLKSVGNDGDAAREVVVLPKARSKDIIRIAPSMPGHL